MESTSTLSFPYIHWISKVNPKTQALNLSFWPWWSKVSVFLFFLIIYHLQLLGFCFYLSFFSVLRKRKEIKKIKSFFFCFSPYCTVQCSSPSVLMASCWVKKSNLMRSHWNSHYELWFLFIWRPLCDSFFLIFLSDIYFINHLLKCL